MFTKMGKKFIQGAKAELEERPPMILDTDKILNLVLAGLGLAALALAIFGGSRSSKQPMMVTINNYYISK